MPAKEPTPAPRAPPPEAAPAPAAPVIAPAPAQGAGGGGFFGGLGPPGEGLFTPERVLALQRAAGNHAVSRMLAVGTTAASPGGGPAPRAASALQRVETKQPPERAALKEGQPPPGSFAVSFEDGAWWYVFHADDARQWSDRTAVPWVTYIKHVFPRATDPIAAEARSNFQPSTSIEPLDPSHDVVKLAVDPTLHAEVKTWMAARRPPIKAREHRLGMFPLAGSAEPSDLPPSATREGPGATEDVLQLRTAYDQLRKEYGSDPVFSDPGVSIEDFLQVLAEHPELRAKLLQRDADGADASKEDLKLVLDRLASRRHPELGSDRGKPEGSEDGVVKFKPAGTLHVFPDTDKYVKGSEARLRVRFAEGDTQRVILNVLPNRAHFTWFVMREKEYVTGDTGWGDVGFDFNPDQAGAYTVGVTIASPRFENGEKLELERSFVVVEEAAREQEIFERVLVGEDTPTAPFQRGPSGELVAKPGSKPLPLEDEVRAIDIKIAMLKTFGEKGKLAKADVKTYTEYFVKQREGLEEVIKEVGDQTPYLVKGTFVSRENSASTEVTAYMTRTERIEGPSKFLYGVELHDSTLGSIVHHPGEGQQNKVPEQVAQDPNSGFAKAERAAIAAMAKHWHEYNDYPDGRIHLAIKTLEDGAVVEHSIDTYTLKKTGKKGLAIASGVAGLVALGASPFTGGGSAPFGVVLLKVATVTAIATGAASVVIELDDRAEKEKGLKADGRLALDVLSLVSLGFGAAGFSRVLQAAGKVSGMYLVTVAGLDAAQAVLIGDQVRQEMIGVHANYELRIQEENDPVKKAELVRERDAAMAQIIASAAISGGFMLVSTAQGVRQIASMGRLSGRKYTVRENYKAMVDADDVPNIRNALDEHSAGKAVLTDPERAFLEEAAGTTPPREHKVVPEPEQKPPPEGEQKPPPEGEQKPPPEGEQKPSPDPEEQTAPAETEPEVGVPERRGLPELTPERKKTLETRIEELGAEIRAREERIEKLKEKATRRKAELEEQLADEQAAAKGQLNVGPEHPSRRNPDEWRSQQRARAAKKHQKKIAEQVTPTLEEAARLQAEVDQMRQAVRHAGLELDPVGKRALIPCFTADTPVWTSSGTAIRIDALRPGDELRVYDFQRSETVVGRVRHMIRRKTDELFELQVSGQVIRTTREHPFWSESERGWVPAAELVAGTQLLLVGGEHVTLDAIRAVPAPDTPTYNLVVDDHPNYFVGPGVLVHNGGPLKSYDYGKYTIYRATNPADPGKVYIGKTLNDVKVREGQHRAKAEVMAELADLTPENKAFFKFMEGAELTPVVEGLNADQAAYMEQVNLEYEQMLRESKIMNRQTPITSEARMKVLEQKIRNDPLLKSEDC